MSQRVYLEAEIISEKGREIVSITIVDLDAFVHVPPEAEVCAYDRDNNAITLKKFRLRDIRVVKDE